MIESNWWATRGRNSHVNRAIVAAVCRHVARWIVKELPSCRHPATASLKDLAEAMGLADDRDLRAKRSGNRAFSYGDLLCLAAIFDVTPRRMMPPTVKAWLMAITEELSGVPADDQDVQDFVSYCLISYRERPHYQRFDDPFDAETIRVLRDACGPHRSTEDSVRQRLTAIAQKVVQSVDGRSGR